MIKHGTTQGNEFKQNVKFKEVGIEDLVLIGKWYFDLAKEFQAVGQTEKAAYFANTVEEIVLITNEIMNAGLRSITNSTLSDYDIKAITVGTNLADEVEAVKIIKHEVSKGGHSERVNIVLANPAMIARENVYRRKMRDFIKSNRQFEMELIHGKVDEKDLALKAIKHRIEYYIRNGKRRLLVEYLIESIFTHSNMTHANAHQFINAYKEKYKLPEPSEAIRNVPEINETTNKYELPKERWLKVKYRTLNTPSRLEEKFVMWPKDVEHSLCDSAMAHVIPLNRVVVWRRATIEEVRVLIVPKLKFNSAPYRVTMDYYGLKMTNIQ